MRAADYARISVDRAGAGVKVADQHAGNLALIEARGWHHTGSYEDNDISAHTGKRRPGYERLLADIAAGLVDVVVAWHPDRLHRSPTELERFIDVVEAAGASVVTVQAGTIDLSTPSGRLVARQLGVVARYESEHKAARQRAANDRAARSGAASPRGIRAFGYEPDRVTIRPEEAALIADAARRLAAGVPVRAICAEWAAKGARTPAGNEWAPGPFKRMITSPRVAGLRQHRGDVVGDAGWPAIIDRETWETVRRVLADPARRAQAQPRRYLLTGGRARCGRPGCGAPLVARPRAGKRYYVCAAGPGIPGCGRVRCIAADLEDWVLTAAALAVDSGRFAAVAGDRGRHRGGVVAGDLAGVDDQLDQADEDHADGLIDRRSWLTLRQRLTGRRDALRARLAVDTRASALALVAGPGPVGPRLRALGLDGQRAVIDAVLASVTVGPAVQGRNFFDPGRVTPLWRA